MDFDSPLDKMPNEELCVIAADKGDIRNKDVIKQLELRGITAEKREHILISVLEQQQKEHGEHLIILQANEDVGYSFRAKVAILVLGPLSLLSHFGFLVRFAYKPWDINYLRENNFKRKIKERKELLIVGFILWVLYALTALKFDR